MTGFATVVGTAKFSERFKNAGKGHFRFAQGLKLSSIGIGTYLGNWDDETDEAYTNSIVRFVELGGNVIDTAINYRFQRSERSIGRALKVLFEKGFQREEIFVATKAGYLPFDGEPAWNVEKYFEENFVKRGLASFEDLADRSHCIRPEYLQSQIDKSLENLGLETIDLFYIHNPESQLHSVDRETFEKRLLRAFELLERNRQDGKIKFYGVATWNGFRTAPEKKFYHSLEQFYNLAKQVGGETNGFKFVQLPYNFSMLEAYFYKNQPLGEKRLTVLEAAKELGITVMCSASLLQGSLINHIPDEIRKLLGDGLTDAAVAIQFVRSTPGVTTALVGMSQIKHVEENMSLVSFDVVEEDSFERIFNLASSEL
ncbi:MAG: aldo/keto reductase [Pyrinomonadaceae bacterium]|nr:aldo/keto reductase [Pyrinomonadaceae bacterium]MCX7640111.1 aldo/keto reductase [Pyrinomonadaceae bacterium]MDW8303301.1 aldo/keto reductase [Acidobacteriota bacterium]